MSSELSEIHKSDESKQKPEQEDEISAVPLPSQNTSTSPSRVVSLSPLVDADTRPPSPERSLSPKLGHALSQTTSRGSTSSNRFRTFNSLSRYNSLGGLAHDVEFTAEKQDDEKIRPRHLFTRPIVRQYIHDQTLIREKEVREPSRFELFFDLIFVGILQNFGHSVDVGYNRENLFKFILLFYPLYSIWAERNFLNKSGTDDVRERISLIVTMMLLLGYGVNASGIALHSYEYSGKSVQAFDGLNAAIAFFLVAKAQRFFFNLFYAYALPRFRKAHLVYALSDLVMSAFYFPLLFTTNRKAFWSLLTVGIISDLLPRYGLAAVLVANTDQKRFALSSNEDSFLSTKYIPAINVEHHVERTAQFALVVFGESILNLAFTAYTEDIGVSARYGKSVLGLLIAFCLCWLYFEADYGATFSRALREHWITATSLNQLHVPLSCALILFGASLVPLLDNRDVEEGVKWYLGGSLSVVMLCLALMHILHKHLEEKGSAVISPGFVTIARLSLALIFALLPLSQYLNRSAYLLAIYAGLVVALTIFETVGKLGTSQEDDKTLKRFDSRHQDNEENVLRRFHSRPAEPIQEMAEDDADKR